MFQMKDITIKRKIAVKINDLKTHLDDIFQYDGDLIFDINNNSFHLVDSNISLNIVYSNDQMILCDIFHHEEVIQSDHKITMEFEDQINFDNTYNVVSEEYVFLKLFLILYAETKSFDEALSLYYKSISEDIHMTYSKYSENDIPYLYIISREDMILIKLIPIRGIYNDDKYIIAMYYLGTSTITWEKIYHNKEEFIDDVNDNLKYNTSRFTQKLFDDFMNAR